MGYAEAVWLYLLLVAGTILVPGMDMAYVLANALTAGRRSGLAAVSGIMVGGAVHTLFGTIAVGALSQMPELLFRGMIVAGAAYMAWIGYGLVGSSVVVQDVEPTRARGNTVVFRQGLITCLINPKAYLFVLAVFPQFLRPEYGALWLQALVLGAITVLMQLVIYGPLALAGGRARDVLLDNPGLTIWISRGTGALFMLAAIFTAWHGITGHVGS